MNLEELVSYGGKGNEVLVCLEGKRKLLLMRDMRIMPFVQIELMACRDELDWFKISDHCAVKNNPE